MEVLFKGFLFVIGACLGSFLCCQARRLHRKVKKQKSLGSRSVCEHCHYQLKWYDNLPIISWLMLGGKCRKCHKKIGLAELFSELGLATAFLLLGFTASPTDGTIIWTSFVIVLMFTTILSFLAIYDGLYGELPTLFLVVAIIISIVILSIMEYLAVSAHSFAPDMIWKPLLSVAILGGIYLVLYLISKGKWVGDGDWLLGTAIGIALFEPWLALIALSLANLIACLAMYPFVRSKRSRHIHFGPFLVIAFVIVYSFSNFFLSML